MPHLELPGPDNHHSISVLDHRRQLPADIDAAKASPVEVRLGAVKKLRIYHEGRLALAPAGSPPQDDPAHARARRRLRQQTPSKRPREKTLRFEQRPEASTCWLAVAPIIVGRPLAEYEDMLPCRPS